MTKVFIDGSAGTTGLRIADRLAERKDISLLTLPENLRKDTDARRQMINSSDITFLCLPDDAAREAVRLCENEHTKIIDASTAHRTEAGWRYGLPELSPAHREAVRNGKRVAVPGCHASGFCVLVYPLVQKGILPADYPIAAHSVTGYSGGGKSMIADYSAENRPKGLDSPGQYALNANHKHLKEMTAVCGLKQKPLFNPIVADFYSGMVVSVPLYVSYLNGFGGIKELHEFFCEYYKDEKLITVLPFHEKGTESGFLYANELAGKDSMQIIVCGNDERALVAARFDNLGKGASGAAVQCMNIMLGIEETTGLSL
ncbi:MAG TPA: N-acetyl-gamma-glutamyl-phosphate reductase [Bacillota bacterium]|nr:N-acetyl-gamma-glutamyl-phosphate reductase [Bacillota bacterium]HOK68343.1 N-acetyl-gamma-glutamyl-phosphate reductase [Bacillota bacterium]HPP85253.1 N-acetyl-gamma-glutamyl-phosphate reductase [Bacillota bacterium]